MREDSNMLVSKYTVRVDAIAVKLLHASLEISWSSLKKKEGVDYSTPFFKSVESYLKLLEINLR